MAEFFHLIEADFLTAFLRERMRAAAEDRETHRFILNRWFPPEPTETIDVEWDAGPTRTFETAIPFRTWTVESDIGRRDGVVRKSGEIAPLSRKYPLTERDIIKLREALRQGGSAETAAQEIFLRDIDKLVQGFMARMELVMAVSLDTGQVAMTQENGLQLTVDWARSATHADTVSTGWAAAPTTCTPIDDEEAVVDVLRDDADMEATDIAALMNLTQWRAWRNSTQVRENFQSVRVLDKIKDSDLRMLREDLGLPEALVYDGKARQVDGTLRKLVLDGKVIYLPRAAAVGATKWAKPAIAEDDDLELDLNLEPGPVAYMTKTLDPYGTWTNGQAIGFPIFADTESTYSLDTEP